MSNHIGERRPSARKRKTRTTSSAHNQSPFTYYIRLLNINRARFAAGWKRELLFITAFIIARFFTLVNSFSKFFKNFFANLDPPSRASLCLCHISVFARHYHDKTFSAKYTKITTTIRDKFFVLYFLPKFTTKNRTKWIFTNLCRGCIMIIPNKALGPRLRFINIPAQLVDFSAKYQSYDICTQRKTPVVLSFYPKIAYMSHSCARKCKKSFKTMEKIHRVCYNIMKYYLLSIF